MTHAHAPSLFSSAPPSGRSIGPEATASDAVPRSLSAQSEVDWEDAIAEYRTALHRVVENEPGACAAAMQKAMRLGQLLRHEAGEPLPVIDS